MTAITLRGLWARKLRAGLTALAVLLVVMMISGTYVFTDTINHSFDRIFDTANKGVDVKVVPQKTIDTQEVQQPPFSESLLPKVRSARGVAKADGGVNDVATVFDKHTDDFLRTMRSYAQESGVEVGFFKVIGGRRVPIKL